MLLLNFEAEFDVSTLDTFIAMLYTSANAQVY
jgi:hypothetical protein